MAVLTWNKVDFKAKSITRDKGNFLIIKWQVAGEDMIILNVPIPNNRALKYMKQKLIELQGETDKSSTILRDLNTPLLIITRTSRNLASETQHYQPILLIWLF